MQAIWEAVLRTRHTCAVLYSIFTLDFIHDQRSRSQHGSEWFSRAHMPSRLRFLQQIRPQLTKQLLSSESRWMMQCFLAMVECESRYSGGSKFIFLGRNHTRRDAACCNSRTLGKTDDPYSFSSSKGKLLAAARILFHLIIWAQLILPSHSMLFCHVLFLRLIFLSVSAASSWRRWYGSYDGFHRRKGCFSVCRYASYLISGSPGWDRDLSIYAEWNDTIRSCEKRHLFR